MNYCSDCGAATRQAVPDGDNRQRHICSNCEMIHYQNPKVIAGVLPTWGEQILLCRRDIEPRRGFWTLPAGLLESAMKNLWLTWTTAIFWAFSTSLISIRFISSTVATSLIKHLPPQPNLAK